MGFSSVRGAEGSFRNREFFYTPAGRHGLLAVVGGAPAAFTRTHLAPPDADFYSENEVNLPAVYATVKDVAARFGPPGAADKFDDQIKTTGIVAPVRRCSTPQCAREAPRVSRNRRHWPTRMTPTSSPSPCGSPCRNTPRSSALTASAR